MTVLKNIDGRYLQKEGEVYKILGEDAAEPVVWLETEDGQRRFITKADLRFSISQGHVSEAREPVFGHSARSPRQKRSIEIKKAVLSAVQDARRAGLTWSKAVQEARQSLEARNYAELPNPFPAVRTIQNWIKEFAEKGNSALMDRRCNSGNRTKRHDVVFETIVLDLLEERFLTSDLMTVDTLVRISGVEYRRTCEKAGLTPSPHGRKVIETILKSLPHDDVVKGRLGSKAARKRLIQAGRLYNIKDPFERLEIDSSRVDIFVIVDHDGTYARPWITVAIDCATGVVLGMIIRIAAPDGMATVMTLREAMTPHDEAFFVRHGIKTRRQAFGTPLAVIADQGSENKGSAVDHLIQSIETEFQLAIPGHPEKKPHVESFFKTFSNFVTQFPGATKSAEYAARERTKIAQKENLLTLEDFINLVQRWRFDVYGHQERRRIQSAIRTKESPWHAWERLEKENLLPEPPSMSQIVELFFCDRRTRRLHKYGVEVEKIQYSNELLQSLLRTQNVREVEVLLDPMDIRSIRVVHPLTGETFAVKSKLEDLPAISFAELKRICAKQPSVKDADEIDPDEIRAALFAEYHHPPSSARTPGAKAVAKGRAAGRNQEIITRTKAGVDETAIVREARDVSVPVPIPRSRAKLTRQSGN